MPIHEFCCEQCKTVFEKLILSSADDGVVCPKCSSQKIKQLISAASCMTSKGETSCSPSASTRFS